MMNPDLCMALVDRLAADLDEFANPKIEALRKQYGWSDDELADIAALVWGMSRFTTERVIELCDETTAETFRQLEGEL